MKLGDLVRTEGGMDTLLWDRRPLDTRETKKLSHSETGLVVETAGAGTDVIVKVIASNGQVGWNWESFFILIQGLE